MKMSVLGCAVACLLLAGSAFASNEMAREKGCLNCHAVDHKVMGPSFQDVANKYNTAADGAQKIEASIMNGSQGTWGSMAMPKQGQVSEADVKALAKWILSQSAAPPANE